jgi:hypothetical protein
VLAGRLGDLIAELVGYHPGPDREEGA